MITIRDCAQAIAAAIADHRGDQAALGRDMDAALRRLMTRDDLIGLGAPREGNNVAMSRYLYFDGELSILLYEVPKGRTIPPHDHGTWETVSVYRGRMRHVVYARDDDGTKPGFAELRAIDDRVLLRHDFAIVAPPNDIHSFTALDEGTYGITVVNGPYKAERLYYNAEEKSYVVKRQRNAR
jgi:predicted metal-dependent enzyme (double-stranded beta helix superfamily)